jgi:hypothetical protein
VLANERQIVLGANHRPRVAGQEDDVERPEDGVDRGAAKSEFAQMAARQERVRALK